MKKFRLLLYWFPGEKWFYNLVCMSWQILTGHFRIKRKGWIKWEQESNTIEWHFSFSHRMKFCTQKHIKLKKNITTRDKLLYHCDCFDDSFVIDTYHSIFFCFQSKWPNRFETFHGTFSSSPWKNRKQFTKQYLFSYETISSR